MNTEPLVSIVHASIKEISYIAEKAESKIF
jgi:hypothetical protein